ncbi:hypothetical protein [Brevibacillus massiliensis]|uniref:hypothetical protein n=1 Tax=Brevibacillus massiliensis TaxID=1118054 RepID=UPI0002E7A000|nr:hypothetical protein [Brevibacillus massiliensis]
MDVDKSLQQLRDTADRTLLQDVVFSADLERQVLERVRRTGGRRGWFSGGWIAAAAILLCLIGWAGSGSISEWLGQSGRAAGSPSETWQPSRSVTAIYEGNPFSYVGEKPVRIIAGEMYEGQAQKVLWLLNGSFASSVQIVGTSAAGEKVELGSWRVGGPVYDADGSFPSSIALPDAGVWKLEVISDGVPLGHVFVKVKGGVSDSSKEWLEPLLIQYLTRDKAFDWIGSPRFASVDIFGVEGNAERKTVYAWALVESIGKEGDEYVSKAGVSLPLAFQIEYGYQLASKGSDYRVVSHQEPKDGNLYWSSIEQIFPAKYLDKISERQGNVEDLHQQNIERYRQSVESGK